MLRRTRTGTEIKINFKLINGGKDRDQDKNDNETNQKALKHLILRLKKPRMRCFNAFDLNFNLVTLVDLYKTSF